MRAIHVELMKPAPSKFRTTASGVCRVASSQAASRVSSARRSTSPTRSITAAPSMRRTPVARSLVVMVASCVCLAGRVVEPHDELEDVRVLVTGLVRLVDHLLDQEQAPPSGALEPRQLGLEVGHLVVGVGASAAVVDDLDADLVRGGQDSHGDGLVGAVAVAV